MKVWVCFRNNAREGCSEPMHVFDSKEKADIWVMGATDVYDNSADCKEMETK